LVAVLVVPALIFGAGLGVCSGIVHGGHRGYVTGRRYAIIGICGALVGVLGMLILPDDIVRLARSVDPLVRTRALLFEAIARAPLVSATVTTLVMLAVRSVTTRIPHERIVAHAAQLGAVIVAFGGVAFVPWQTILMPLMRAIEPDAIQFFTIIPDVPQPRAAQLNVVAGDERCVEWLDERRLSGDRTVGVCRNADDSGSLWLIGSDYGLRLVPDGVLWQGAITVSPDETWVIYAAHSERTGQSDGLYALNLIDQRTVTITRAPLVNPVWMGDGTLQADYVLYLNGGRNSARYIVPLPAQVR
jgi:hypothetical protein